MEKNLDKFADYIAELRPTNFIGLALTLGVELFNDKIDKETKKVIARPAEDILCDCLDQINQMSRAERRDLLKVLRATIKNQKEGDE